MLFVCRVLIVDCHMLPEVKEQSMIMFYAIIHIYVASCMSGSFQFQCDYLTNRQPWFWDWAFNLNRGDPIQEKWDMIPDDGIDVLITHGPPIGIAQGEREEGERVK